MHSPAVPDSFTGFGLPEALVEALTRQGITEPYPIQTATLADSLAGRDVLGCGRTGSGKTYAFVLPLLARLSSGDARPRGRRRPRALILAPTRELASQIGAALAPLARAVSLTSVTVFGGTAAAPQIKAFRDGVDIVVACPGRLEDHVRSGFADLGAVEITVLDEADHMADLGFLPVVKRLLDKTPKDGQRLLFSATLDRDVDSLSRAYLRNPVRHQVDAANTTPTLMTHHVLEVTREARLPVLVDLASAPGRTLVFTRTRHGAKKLAKSLSAAGVRAVELHGDLSQAHRTRNLSAFARGDAPTLVATDIAARGIHVDDIQLVIHADPPAEHKAYLHRSGRTARAGASGTVVTLAAADQVREVGKLTDRAGIRPVVTRISAGDPLLEQIAPGERVRSAVPLTAARPEQRPSRPRGDASGSRGQRGRRSTPNDASAHAQGGGSRRRPRRARSSTAR